MKEAGRIAEGSSRHNGAVSAAVADANSDNAFSEGSRANKAWLMPLLCSGQMIIVYLLIFFLMPSRTESPISMICIILNACLAIVLSVVCFRTELIGQWKEFLKNRLWKKALLVFLLVFLAQIAGGLIERAFGATGSNNGEVAKYYTAYFPVIMQIYLCLIAPVAEELVFRFSLEKLLRKKWLFIGVSSTVFGLMHVLSGDYYAIFPYLFTGFTLALFYAKTKNIFVTIGAHALLNILVTLLSMISV